MTFRLPTSTVQVELNRHPDQWTLAYLGGSAVGLEDVDQAIFHFEVDVPEAAVARDMEWRLKAGGCRPVRIDCELQPPRVAAWRV